MSKQLKVAKLLAPTVPLILEVEDHKLELKLAWTMRAVMLLESRLRAIGQPVNVLQNPSQFWTELNVTSLVTAVWALSLQEQPEYGDDSGFETITSFLVTDNLGTAASAIKEAFLESLSEERRTAIREAEKIAKEQLEKEREKGTGPANLEPTSDPTPAPGQ
jgi:hypothetical protein